MRCVLCRLGDLRSSVRRSGNWRRRRRIADDWGTELGRCTRAASIGRSWRGAWPWLLTAVTAGKAELAPLRPSFHRRSREPDWTGPSESLRRCVASVERLVLETDRA